MKIDHPLRDGNSFPGESEPKTHRRPVWIVLFATILVLTAGFASAQESIDPNTSTVVEYNGVQHVLPKVPDSEQEALAKEIEARQSAIAERANSRVKYASINAVLANFDADASPDGWRVEVMLLDAKDRPVSKRAHAAFELMPRMPAMESIGYVNAKVSPIRWSMPLKFDQNVAEVKLPLKLKLAPVFDRHVAFVPDPGLGTTIGDSRRVVLRRSLQSTSRSAFSRDWRYNVGRPEFGQLKARISVPTEGVFETVTDVPMRPSVLVDTNWPYR